MSFKSLFLLLLFSPFFSFSENLVMFPDSYNFIKEKAYSKKDKEYLFEMGKIHYYGVKHQGTDELFIKPNMAKSLEDFKESYDLGYKKETAPFIAHMYFYGAKGVRKDKREGLKYYKDVLKYGSSKDKDEAISIINENQDEINRIQPDFFRTTEGLSDRLNPYDPPITTPTSQIISDPPLTTTPTSPDPIPTTPTRPQIIPDLRNPQSVPENGINPSLIPPPKITKEQFIEFKNTFEPYLDIQIAKAKKLQAFFAQVAPSDVAKANLQIWLSRAEEIKRKIIFMKDIGETEEVEKLKKELLELLETSPFSSILRGVRVNSIAGTGNGFLYSSKYIITNYHVISDNTGVKKQAQTGQSVSITLTSGKKKSANIIYYDCDLDLALLEIIGNPITNGDLLEPSERIYLQQLAKKGLVTEEEINKMFQAQLNKNIPLTSNVPKGSVVEYLKSDLSVIESGKVIFLNNDYGQLKETNIVPGYSGGGVFNKNEVACVTQGSQRKIPLGQIKSICISSDQIEPFIKKANLQPEKFCKCKNLLLILGAINKYTNSKSIEIMVSARAFLLQASKESIELMSKAEGINRFKDMKKYIENRIKNLNTKEKKKTPNHQEPTANACKYF